jgi:uncharacterized protein (DUF1786 family)
MGEAPSAGRCSSYIGYNRVKMGINQLSVGLRDVGFEPETTGQRYKFQLLGHNTANKKLLHSFSLILYRSFRCGRPFQIPLEPTQ